MSGGKAIILLGIGLAAALALPAHAGTIWRCDAPDGSRTYASKRVKGATCTAMSTYTPAAPRPAPAAPTRVASEPAPTLAPATPAAATVPVSIPASSPPPMQRSGATRRVQGQVYSYVKDGVRHYSSRPPKGVQGATAVRTIPYSFIETCYACAPLPGVNFGKLRLNTTAYESEIRAAARQHGVDEAVVRAIIHAESSYNPLAVSRVGAQGLMQLMPATARRFGVTDSYNAGQNIRGGAQYLAWLLKRFNGNLTLAAAGYNAGEGAVDRHGGVPPYKETQRYVQRVAVLADRYRQAVAAR